jgi:3-oxoacyl-[acyl-carrier protein] reductase
MMFGLTGKFAVVTGGSRGIGRACVLALGRLGAHVTINYRDNEAAANETLAQLTAAGGCGELARFDVGDEAGCNDALRAIGRRHGRLDILVNNAGMAAGDELVLKLGAASLERVLRTNLLGAFHCCKPALFFMMRGRWGRIVNLSSVVAHTGNTGQSAYAAAKAGLEGMTRTLAREYGARGITANAVAPGLIETDMTASFGPEVLTAAGSQIPSGRTGQPEDVAALVAFLCSVEAGYVNGQVIAVNGGMLM